MAVLATLVVAGCGSAQPLTRKQLIRRADAICLRVQRKTKKLPPAKTAQMLAKDARKLAGFEQQEIEAMRKLIPPRSLRSDWKQIIEGVDEAVENAGTLSTDIELKQKKHAEQALVQIVHVQERLAPIVKRDGFKECGQLL